MIWFTWRQFRTQAAVTAVVVTAFAVLLLITGRTIVHLYADVSACQSDCTTVVEQFLFQVRNGASGRLYDVGLSVMYALPPLVGIFWGAPLVARELESGTHRLAWNQSVTRTRWLATKLVILGTATAATMGLLSWAVTAWAHHVDSAAADRITPMVYGARGVVPIGYALFAFILGVTAGMLIRRTVPAMAATLAVYAVVAASMPLWIRSHLVPARHDTPALDVDRLHEVTMSRDRGDMHIFGRGVPGAWTVSNQTITPAGQPFTGPADPTACGVNGSPARCNEWISGLNLRQDITYHPTSHFWSLQWTETGILLALAAALAGLCFWWLRRRLS
jgi:hypothetical protein